MLLLFPWKRGLVPGRDLEVPTVVEKFSRDLCRT